jgi:hypothetical protein
VADPNSPLYDYYCLKKLNLKNFYEDRDDMTTINIPLITYTVSMMTRQQQIEWAAKMTEEVKTAVRDGLIEMRNS